MSSAALTDGELRLTPVRVVDESLRVARPPAISAARYGSRTVFFHDEVTAAEPAGYWTQGRATTQVTYAMAADTPPAFDVKVRCGPIANRVILTAPGWTERLALDAGATVRVSIPTMVQSTLGVRVAPLDITVRDGFVPAEVDRASTDRRLLGCWIDMGQGE